MMAQTIGEHVQRWVGLGKFPVLAHTRELTLHILFRMIDVDITELDQWRHYYEEFMLGGLAIPFYFPGSPAYRAEQARVWLDARLTKNH
jgi:cytochrome P450